MAMELDGDNETATRSLNVPQVEQFGARTQLFHMTPRARGLREQRSDPGSTSTSPRNEVRTEMMMIQLLEYVCMLFKVHYGRGCVYRICIGVHSECMYHTVWLKAPGLERLISIPNKID